MKLEDALRQALPGPYRATGGGDQRVVMAPGNRLIADCAYKFNAGKSAAHAALLAHCFNHFQKLVAAMKDVLECGTHHDVTTGIGTMSEATPAYLHAMEILAEVNEVKV